MSKSLLYIIPDLVKMEENFSRLYHNIATIEGQYSPKLKTMAMILSRQESTHADIYRDLQDTLTPFSLIIEDDIYDIIHEKIMNFTHLIAKTSFKDEAEFLKYALDYENKTSELLTEIKSLDLPKEIDQFVDKMLVAENSHIHALANFLH